MKKKAVFLANRTNNSIKDVYSGEILETLKSMVDLCQVYIDRDNLEEHLEIIRNAEVAFSTWGMPEFTEEEILKYMPNLRVVFYAAGTVQGFARTFIRNNIIVVSAWAANAIPVAEYSAAQILLANKGFFQSMTMAKRSYEEARAFSESFPGNHSVRIGILGAGMIGSKVIELMKPYNVEILVYDPFLSDERAESMGVTKHSLNEIFTQCQTISNHLANLPATVGILNKEQFSLMPNNATFINTGRGEQIVEKDLVDALKAVPTRSAVLDVTYPEPLEKGSILLKMENVFITPHIAGSMNNELKRMAQYVMDEFVRYESGEKLKYSVTLKMLETMA